MGKALKNHRLVIIKTNFTLDKNAVVPLYIVDSLNYRQQVYNSPVFLALVHCG